VAAKETKARILIVDDDRIILDSLSEFLSLEGYEVRGGDGFQEAVRLLERESFQIVITDVNMPEVDGFELLRVVKSRFPELVVIIITGYGTIESAVEAIKMGAYDYLTKPIIDDEIRLVVDRAMKQQSLIQENRNLRTQLNMRYSLDSIIGHDYKMLKVFDMIESVADSKATILMTGESGTGKSLVARAIHHRSSRSEKPFVEVSCGAMPETLLESELFGHAKGSFTGAVNDKEGKFVAADNGTIFLDEINSASPALQAKLLRVLQERHFEPVGSNETITVDVRVVLATNVTLEAEVEAGRFRRDLFYRINVVQIELPRLCERIGDIPLLAEHFLKVYAAQSHKEVLGFTEEATRAMQRYHWPGNVRELENCVERAVVLTKGKYIGIEDLPPNVLEQPTGTAFTNEFQPMSLKRALEDPEKRIIEAALRANNWNRQVTADLLEINRTTLYKKMRRYGLERDPNLVGAPEAEADKS
jgi:DNA-binding NtrC family response regulator